jgi:carboxypeptidase Q
LVVESFDELEQRKVDASGKIVLFNHKWIDYPSSVDYRVDGPSIAAKYGAKAMLVRSLASESIYSVHTGYMQYDPQYEKIPCAAITVEDSEMFKRMQNRGQKIVVELNLETQFVPNSNSANLIFEIVGA